MKKFVYSRIFKNILGFLFVTLFSTFITCGYITLSLTDTFDKKDIDCESFYDTKTFKDTFLQEFWLILDTINQIHYYSDTYEGITDDSPALALIDYRTESTVYYSYNYLSENAYNLHIPYSFYDYDESESMNTDLTIASLSEETATDIAKDEQIIYINESDEDTEVYGLSDSNESIMAYNGASYFILSSDEYASLIEEYGFLNTDSKGEPINKNFSSTSYIYEYNNYIALYSPDDNLFFTSTRGWFSVDSVILFNSDHVYSQEDIYTGILTTDCEDYEAVAANISNDYSAYVSAIDYLDTEFSYGNILYYLSSNSFNKVYTNGDDQQDIIDRSVVYITYDFSNKAVETNSGFTLKEISSYIPSDFPKDSKVTIGVLNSGCYDDLFYDNYNLFNNFFSHYTLLTIITIITGLISLLILCILISITGHNADSKEIKLIYFDNIFTEVTIVMFLVSLYTVASRLYYGGFQLVTIDSYLIFTVGLTSICCLICLLTGLSLVRLIKKDTYFKKFFSYKAIRYIASFNSMIFKGKSYTFKAVMYYGGFSTIIFALTFISCVAFSNGRPVVGNAFLILLIIFLVGVGISVIKNAYTTSKIIKATAEITEGNIEYQIDLAHVHGYQELLGNNINHIGEVLNKAIETSTKDERLKAALITNVSHDIKTPLTSIINYVDLIRREDITDETILHYLDVLDQKSKRLKSLSEALVEASKVTTGNIELNFAPLDLTELIKQALGEFEDKFLEKRLQLVSKFPESTLPVMIDGQKTYRVLENLLQNIYKYAMPETRIYIDTAVNDTNYTLSIKNISKSPLNITPDELTERFVRGDQARTTEGSGLGLSIAKELIILQHGSFEIQLDGDLFKIVITFPIYHKKENKDANVIVDADN